MYGSWTFFLSVFTLTTKRLSVQMLAESCGSVPTKVNICATATSQRHHFAILVLVLAHFIAALPTWQTRDGNGPSWHKRLCKHVTSSVNTETQFKFQDANVQKCNFKKVDK